MAAPINHRPLGLTVSIVTLALDQLVKYTVTYPLALQSRGDEGIDILPIFRLRWLENRGVSMGFFHAVCPTDHELAGYYACDRSLNGAYSVDAAMTRAMAKGCPDCTAEAKEKIMLMYLGYEDRILPKQLDGTPVGYLDAAPEGKR